tara:strand:+ start:91667 stop:92437 length:771 start_codon:yes stop_codon:yes gene_type:complete
MIVLAIALMLVVGYFLFSPARQPQAERGPIILAASSLQESLEEAADAWGAAGHARPVLSFAGSSALARQIDAGAPADLFLSADEQWMDWLEQRDRLAPGSRASWLGNHLVLVGARDDKRDWTPRQGDGLAKMLGGERLALADPDVVPAGKYAKAALQSLGLWDDVAGQLAPAENVRAALALVERGQAPLGIVYATDAQASRKVRVIGVFPDASHPPIRYALARLAASRNGEAEGFQRFLMTREAGAIFARHGFEPL